MTRVRIPSEADLIPNDNTLLYHEKYNHIMRKIIDLSGQRFGRLIVLSEHKSSSQGTMWLCKCDCGVIKYIHAKQLKRGNTQSCGCLSREKSSERRYIHGGKANSERLYSIWKNMNSRCNAKESTNEFLYRYYGSKGIAVCDDWKDYKNFKEWAMNNGYTDELTIDRINGNLGYNPENCRWVTRKIQSNNLSNNIKCEINGQTLTISEIAEKYNLTYNTVKGRLRRGWDIIEIIETPYRGHKKSLR